MSILDFLSGNIFMRRDGSSAKLAVIVNSVAEEYSFIKRKHPGFRPEIQYLCQLEGKAYDVIDISNAAGEKRTLYFDVSGFYGK